MLKRVPFLYELNSLRAYISILLLLAQELFIPFPCDICTYILLMHITRVMAREIYVCSFYARLPFPTNSNKNIGEVIYHGGKLHFCIKDCLPRNFPHINNNLIFYSYTVLS